ncbi:BglG family transcription antiterminator [Butyricicoccus sp.]|uniref:BglG family transcription antiterminator n=1 Tax=Butyricicoccus sp. TaxID=2049021 RepID=UPI003F18E920
MKKRSTEILQRLLKHPEEDLRMQRLQEDYRVSEKTLRNDIEEIMDFTRVCGMSEAVSADVHALHLNDAQQAPVLMERVYAMDPYHYKMSLEERKFYIVITLLWNEGYYSMQQLADEMCVTRNTIVNDCKVVREYFEEYGISFVARNKRGIKIEGAEGKVENLLIDMFLSLLPSLSGEDAFFVQYLMQKTGFPYRLNQIFNYMNCFAKEKNIIFAKEVFFEIAVCIFVLINLRALGAGHPGGRAGEGKLPQQLDVIGSMIQYVAGQLDGVELGANEIVSIERFILRRDLHPEIQSINDFELYGVISHFLLEVSRDIQAGIQNDDLLIKSLISHIKNMRNWSSFEFELDDDREASSLFEQVRRAADDKFYILENYLNYRMNSGMKDSIVIHICAALLRGRANMRPCNVIVSCPGSMATSKYLEAQVRNYFKLNIVGTMTTWQVETIGSSLTEIDFIISTVAIRNCSLPVVVVSPLLTIEDINKIQSFVLRSNQEVGTAAPEQHPLLSRLYDVYTLGDSRKIAYLDRELKRVLEDVLQIESETARKSALLNLLQLKYVQLHEDELEWREAMRLAAKDLIRDGYFDTRYVEKAIENVEEYGSYIIVNKGIALAHANREAGVYADGISLLVAKDGIQFEDGETVYLLFFFSQKGEADYLDLFKEIIRLGNDQGNIEKMRRMDRTSDVYQLIVEILTEY